MQLNLQVGKHTNYKCYLEDMGMKINDARYWVIDENNEGSLNV